MKYPQLSLTTFIVVQSITKCDAFNIAGSQRNPLSMQRQSKDVTFQSFAATLEETDTSSSTLQETDTPSSTLEKTDTPTSTLQELDMSLLSGMNGNPDNGNQKQQQKDSSKSKITVVSGNHVIAWDERLNEMVIKESDDGKELKLSDIVYEDVVEHTNDETFNEHDSSSNHSSFSSEMNNSNLLLKNLNGVKMTNSNDVIRTKPQEGTEGKETIRKDVKLSSSSAENTSSESKTSLTERIANSGVASAAAMATAAVNAAVSMKTLEAPSTQKSYIALDKSQTIIDEDGLPLRYDKDAIETYWKKEKGALNKRWGYFVSKTVPFLTRLTTLFIKDGKIDEQYIPELSRQARIDLQDLGPTFIKAGQMMSVRPDVLPQVSKITFHKRRSII